VIEHVPEFGEELTEREGRQGLVGVDGLGPSQGSAPQQSDHISDISRIGGESLRPLEEDQRALVDETSPSICIPGEGLRVRSVGLPDKWGQQGGAEGTDWDKDTGGAR